jgi:hypothetical protein
MKFKIGDIIKGTSNLHKPAQGKVIKVDASDPDEQTYRIRAANGDRLWMLNGGLELVATEDPINHPPHYTAHPSGVECIQITEHMNFCLGNALKYLWRADLKRDAIEDLKKAAWYINREIERRSK